LLDGRETFATFEFPFTVDKVTFDPDRWWLKRLQKIDYPVTAVDSIEAVEDTLDIVEQAIDSAGMPENIAEVLPEAGPELSVETVGDFATVPDSIEPSPPVPKKNKGCTASSSAPSTAILWLFLGLLSLLAGCRRQYKSFPVFDGQQGQQGQ
jgi:hypothetical protein